MKITQWLDVGYVTSALWLEIIQNNVAAPGTVIKKNKSY